MILENLYTLQFLYINKYRFLQGWSDYDGGVLFSIIRYIIKGSGEFTINGENYRVQEGDILCIPQNATLVSEAMDSNIEFISLSLDKKETEESNQVRNIEIEEVNIQIGETNTQESDTSLGSSEKQEIAEYISSTYDIDIKNIEIL